MRLSFNYTDGNTDRNTERSSQLLNIYSEVINKKPCGKLKVAILKTYFCYFDNLKLNLFIVSN